MDGRKPPDHSNSNSGGLQSASPAPTHVLVLELVSLSLDFFSFIPSVTASAILVVSGRCKIPHLLLPTLISSVPQSPPSRVHRYVYCVPILYEVLHATVSYFPPIGPSSSFQHHRHNNATPTPTLNPFWIVLFTLCFQSLENIA